MGKNTTKQPPDSQAGSKQPKLRVAEKRNLEVFRDVRPDGSEVPWREKKLRSVPVFESFERQGDGKRAEKIRCCGNCLEFWRLVKAVQNGTADFETKYRLFRAYLCKDRLCPLCAWRRSLRTLYVLLKVMERVVTLRPKLVPLSLTLTIPSPEATVAGLRGGLDGLLEGWNRLFQVKRVKSAVKGWFRSVELTYNREKDTFHVHIHALILVPYSSYFNRGGAYIDHSEWLELWRRAARDESITQVDIRRAKDKTGKKSSSGTNLPGYLFEFSKYITKDSGFVFEDCGLTDRILSVLSKAVHKRRFHSFGGVMKKIAAELKLLDKEGDEDLLKVWDNDDSEGWKVVAALLVRWYSRFSNYFIADDFDLCEKLVDGVELEGV